MSQSVSQSVCVPAPARVHGCSLISEVCVCAIPQVMKLRNNTQHRMNIHFTTGHLLAKMGVSQARGESYLSPSAICNDGSSYVHVSKEHARKDTWMACFDFRMYTQSRCPNSR